MNTPLVSICSPCYNVAPYIGRFLDSLLGQTYKHLEVILVNDGSTDATGDIIKLYLPKLQEEGYKVTYIEQENGGQSSALNKALKEVSGKYLLWPDSDDWFTPDAIEIRIQFLEAHPEIALLRSNIEQIDAATGKKLGVMEPLQGSPMKLSALFHKLVLSKTWFAPIGYTLRVSCLDQYIPEREIHVERYAGQNWQIMLPIAFNCECWQSYDITGYYLIRQDSHSHHNDKTYDEHIRYIVAFKRTLLETLSRISHVPEFYFRECIRHYVAEQISYAKYYKKKKDVWSFSMELLSVTPDIGQKIKILAEAIYHILVRPIFSK